MDFKNQCSVGRSVLKCVVILQKNNYAALKIIDVGIFLFFSIKISFPVHFLFKWRKNFSACPRMLRNIHRMMLHVHGLFCIKSVIAGFGSWRDNIIWCGRIRIFSHSRSDGSSASSTLLFDCCPSHSTADTGNRGKHGPFQCVPACGGIRNSYRILVRKPKGKK